MDCCVRFLLLVAIFPLEQLPLKGLFCTVTQPGSRGSPAVNEGILTLGSHRSHQHWAAQPQGNLRAAAQQRILVPVH